ncbi:MAG TPA: ABC transporter ATP-binding protein [Ignisphaera aggregans]|uniref:ABC transporter ATP-binding protein n=1 Tax=Ignisphaera aggregans TaxID=334771 RepID=A0A833DT97_9CREN|nr:ABC transporter ATP-binding protein [Ignisphaera aggregans]
MVRVKLDHVSKYFGRVRAVEDFNLLIRDGEFVTLLGPSGCGKSTTLLMIAGIYKPTKGRIYFDDQDVTDLPPKDRNVGMVFQSYALYPHMTVYENIAFPLRLKKMPKNEIDRKVREIAKFLKIDHLLDRKPAQLSGGQQQRVALARALVKEPDVLLLDEPLSNLDALLRVYMRAELKRLQKELKVTTVYVTHDQVEALSMSDRIVVMNEGRIQQVGTPDEIYSHPANTFVASFIGTPPMNLIPCTYQETEQGPILKCPGFVYQLPPKAAEVMASRSSDEVYLGIRPEDIEIVEGGARHAEAVVLVVEPLGKDLIVTASLGDDCVIKIATSPTKLLASGQSIGLRFRENRIHVFDKKTGKALI